jgi:hypothetical protein
MASDFLILWLLKAKHVDVEQFCLQQIIRGTAAILAQATQRRPVACGRRDGGFATFSTLHGAQRSQ